MPRAARVLIVSIGLGVGAAVATGAPVAASTPPPPAPVATTLAPAASGAPPTTVVPVVPAGTRGGAVDGSVAKPRHETWNPRRIATVSGLAVIALAAAGYAYGKLRSAPPRHPDLLRRPPDVGVDHADVTG